MDIKHIIATYIYDHLKTDLPFDDIYKLLEKPKDNSHGDLSLPCFIFAKKYKQTPQQVAETFSKQIDSDFIHHTEVVGPYLNIFLNRAKITEMVITEILTKQKNYGNLEIGNNQNITIDWSSPNIAKPFSLGHLRSTVIGNAIALIGEKCNYRAIKINHLGDWGTQFGKLIVAYKKWGDEQLVKENPIEELLKLYVKFHEEVENDPSLEDDGRKWFKKLEDGDEEATKLWQWFRTESLQAFNKIYELLDVKAEYTHGESFYNDKLDEITEILNSSNILEEDNGAKIVRLDDEQLPVCLIRKSDGASLYITRDLATALYRARTFRFAKNIYPVGKEQTLHFKQLKAVLKKLGFAWSEDMIHSSFGLVRQNGKKLSTRKGQIVLLENVITEAIKMAEQAIKEKNPNLQNSTEVALQVGVGAVIFHDLHNERAKDIDFSLETMLKFEGETGPYLQYTNARINSILKRANITNYDTPCTLDDSYSFEVVKLLADFPQTIARAWHKLEPSIVARYLINLAQSFNSYYGNVRILTEDEQKTQRLALAKATSLTITEGLRLLGIKAPVEM